MEPVLTQEELEAIYNAMQADAGPEKNVDDYILASDHAYNMRCIKRWTDIGKNIAFDIEKLFTKRLAARGKVEVSNVRTIEDERESSKNTAGIKMTEVIPLAQTDPSAEYRVINYSGAKLLLGMERDTALRYIDRRTGLIKDEKQENHLLTVLESRLLNAFFIEISSVLEKGLPNQTPITVLKDDPEDFWIERIPFGTWISIEFNSADKFPVSIWLRGPAELFLKESEKRTTLLEKKMGDAKVELVMELGKLKIKAYDLWGLKPGDIFPLGVAMDEPLDVYIGGIYKVKGKPTISRGNVAFEWIDTKNNN